MPRCDIYVTKRQYSAPGPCENKLNVKPVPYDGGTIKACSPHRRMAKGGHHLTINPSRR